jgi:Asp-tRNA(Asn)/Glu-tRNA(Gln) amidotransferase A subunit family amidase
MSPSRRDALRQLGALCALPFVDWSTLVHEVAHGAVDDPLAGTMAAYQAGRAAGTWTAASVTATALQRARAWTATLHAVDLLAETAMAEARASDARLKRGALRGPLDGVPVFAKAIYDVKGLPTTASNLEWSQLFPEPVRLDAVEVARMRAAGAVVLGKTVADDFAYHGVGTSTLSGQVRNPHDRTGTRTPGGSSAGSAVSVACGIAFAALGTDDGGSNRIPAQCTGVVGMKPSFGLVPRSGVIPTWPVLDTHGPLARSVADAALLLDAIAGPDIGDALVTHAPYTRGALRTLRDDALKGARLGLVEAHVPRAQMSLECQAIFDRAITDCLNAGAIVESCSPAVTRVTYRDQFAAAAQARGDIAPNANSPAATANALFRYFQRHGDATHPFDARDAITRGLAAYRAYYDVLPADPNAMALLIEQPYERDAASRSFLRSRESVVAQLAESMAKQQLDALVYPTMPFGAWVTQAGWPDVRTALGFGNWLGLPEVSVPAGYGTDGMPAGNLSFVGLPGTDAKMLALAHAYEQVSRRFVAPPRPIGQ